MNYRHTLSILNVYRGIINSVQDDNKLQRMETYIMWSAFNRRQNGTKLSAEPRALWPVGQMTTGTI